jgi:L,D-transpeptidase catalytic domain
VIRPEQLSEALDRIHPRDRELLSLSLRRRVPDEALGRLYECSPSDVARRRARAIEQVADEMELQRGEDLGAVLQALLEPDTWTRSTVGEEFAAGGGRSRVVPLPVPEQEPDEDEAPEPQTPALAPVPAPAPDGDDEDADPPEIALAQDAAVEAPEEAPKAPPASAAAAPARGPAAPDPVEEMVAERERQAPDPPRRAVPLALVGLGIAALVGAAGVLGATQFGDKERMVPRGSGGGDGTRQFVPQESGPLAAPFATDPDAGSCYTTATINRAATLYRDPGGERRLRIGPKTEWGSERVMGVVSQRGDWLGVQASELKNGEVAWIQRDRVKLDCVQWSIQADLSKHTVTVQHDGKTVKKVKVAIGRAENPTPKGRFSVTDRLAVKGGDPTYGCCVLALTGHQTHLPAYWPGGDRLAIHATNDESSIGHAVSLGCMRAPATQARWLIDHIPLGTPVFIHS